MNKWAKQPFIGGLTYFLKEMNRLERNPELEHPKMQEENIQVEKLVLKDHWLSVRMISEAVGISVGTADTISVPSKFSPPVKMPEIVRTF